jgi:pimeloyl-ACP methyl ester carboxylesterase
VILVGHSYGGAVITEAGNDPKVVGLVYIAGWVPDKGESVSYLIDDLITKGPPGLRFPPSYHRRTAFCCWTRPSSPPPSPAT